ncbi:MAG: hypothetical protein QXH27_05355 [Candidatus Micrarchaeia archaeon]
MIHATPSDALAVKAHDLLKASGAEIKSDEKFGPFDVKRALVRAFMKGVPEERLLGRLTEAKSAVDAIEGINCEIGGEGYVQAKEEEKKEMEARRESALRVRRSFFTPRETEVLAKLGVPEQNIKSGELSEEDKVKIREAVTILVIQQNQLGIVLSRFGLDGGEPKSFKELSKEFAVKEAAIRHIITTAMGGISPKEHILPNETL